MIGFTTLKFFLKKAKNTRKNSNKFENFKCASH